MKKFDHNKLDEYKNAMEVLGEYHHIFEGCIFYVRKTDYSLKIASEKNIKSRNWTDFKEKVANYFLNK